MKKNILFRIKVFILILFVIYFGSCSKDTPDEENKYTLTINYSGNGSITPDSGTYSAGSIITLTPYPDSGWYFHSWEGTHANDVINNQDGTYSITMDEDKSFTAIFLEGIAYILILDITGDGSVEKNPSQYYYAAYIQKDRRCICKIC